jgi:hypothetical protein
MSFNKFGAQTIQAMARQAGLHGCSRVFDLGRGVSQRLFTSGRCDHPLPPEKYEARGY